MSFEFGDFDTAAHSGIVATLKAWPAPRLKPETVDALDGAFYARTGLGPLELSFDVRLSATTPAAVHALRDQLLAACAPHRGLLALRVETGDDWLWWATPSAVSDFTRGLWINGLECQLRGELTFLAPDGFAWASPDDTGTGASPVTITRTKGNLPSYPTITIEGTFSAVAVEVGAVEVNVDLPLTAGQRLVLDYQAMDFGIWDGVAKIAHAAPGMDNFTRPLLPLGDTVVTATATGGAVTSLTVKSNSRGA